MKNRITSLLKHKKIIGSVATLTVLGFLFRGQIQSKIAPKPPYKTAKIERQSLKQTVSASGKVQADQQATLKFQTSGYLAWVGVKKGDRVKKGQTIASLDKEELQKQLKQELIDYMNERWDFEKDRHTYHVSESNFGSYNLEYDIRNLLEKAQFDLNRTVLDVEIKNLALKYATLWTPIDGIVTSIDAPNAGVNITPATAAFVISNPDKMVFTAKVDEADIGQIKEGLRATVLLDAYPEEPITSQVEKVDFTSTTTSSGGTAFEVKLALPENSEEKFKIGMNGDADIIISEANDVLVVPFEAIREKNGEQFVWILENNKPVEKTVKVGFSDNTYTQILEGVSEDQTVITSDFKNLEKNSKK